MNIRSRSRYIESLGHAVYVHFFDSTSLTLVNGSSIMFHPRPTLESATPTWRRVFTWSQLNPYDHHSPFDPFYHLNDDDYFIERMEGGYYFIMYCNYILPFLHRCLYPYFLTSINSSIIYDITQVKPFGLTPLIFLCFGVPCNTFNS